jgi:hypothetical protein
MYESRHQPPLSRNRYTRRVVSHVLCAVALVMLSLAAGLYAPYAGLVFLVTAAIVFAPILHRILHRFHWSEKL